MFSGHNSEWSGSMTMQLQPETLRHLDKLERLNLADNSIWGLPEGALCHTPNLSRNNIVEVSEIGLSGNICQLLHLKSLDLSFNKISSFLPGDLSLFPGLSNLDLRGNHLSVLSPTSLSSLWSLAHLDLTTTSPPCLPPSSSRAPTCRSCSSRTTPSPSSPPTSSLA